MSWWVLGVYQVVVGVHVCPADYEVGVGPRFDQWLSLFNYGVQVSINVSLDTDVV